MFGLRRKRTHRRLAGAITALLSMSIAFARADAAATETTLYAWPGKQTDPGHSAAGLVADRFGNLYGTASGEYYAKGSVFELSPPTAANPNWTENVLYIFTGGADGGFPVSRLVFGKDGSLFGTTEYGGHHEHVGRGHGYPFLQGEGVVFQLVPPKSPRGAWVEHVLHTFRREDTAFPTSGLTPGNHGEYYGVTAGYDNNGHIADAAVYAVYPPTNKDGVWREVTLYRFIDGISPAGGVIADANGNLYGALANGVASGSVYELSRTGSHWIPTELYRFGSLASGEGPYGSLFAGSDGSLYGTTLLGGSRVGSGYGTVYRIAPPATPGGQWQGSVIHAFNLRDGETPLSGVIGDASGALYGTTAFGGAGYGVVFRLTRNGATWHETVLHEFHRVDGLIPNGLLEDGNGTLYGTTQDGTHHGAGTAFAIKQ